VCEREREREIGDKNAEEMSEQSVFEMRCDSLQSVQKSVSKTFSDEKNSKLNLTKNFIKI